MIPSSQTERTPVVDEFLKSMLSMIACDAILTGVIVWCLQRWLGKRLDAFDHRREDAREVAARESEAIAKGVRSLLRAELIHEHRKWVPKNGITLDAKEYVQRTYDAYHNLGGNDVGTAMYEELMGLPTKEVVL